MASDSQTRIAELLKRKQDILARMALLVLENSWLELGDLAGELGSIAEELDWLGHAGE